MRLRAISLMGAAAVAILAMTGTAASASTPPPPPNKACFPYVTSISKSGNTLKYTVKVNCSGVAVHYWLDTEWHSVNHSTPHGDTSVNPGTYTYSHTYSENISAHPGDEYCVGATNLVPGYPLIVGVETCT